MTDYEEVAKLAETLTSEDQVRLLVHLQTLATQHEPSRAEWEALLDSIKITTPIIEPFPLSREDWYDEC